MRRIFKTLILLLLVTVLTASLSVSVFAAKEQFICKSFSITIDEPKDGMPLSFSASDSASDIDITGLEWYEEAPNGDVQQLSSGAKAKLGHSYSVQIIASVVPGSKMSAFSSSILDDFSSVQINGWDADYIEVVSRENNKIKSIFIEYNFGELYEYVDTAEVSITVPKAGEKPSYNAISTSKLFSNNAGNSATYYKNGIMWYDETAGKHMVPGSSDAFKDGHTYTATIVLLPNEGYFFTSDVTGSVNGANASTSFLHAETIVLETSFTLSHAHSESGWKSDKDNHWKECTSCGEKTVAAVAHKDTDKDGKCDYCSYKMAVASSSAQSSKKESSASQSKPAASQSQSGKPSATASAGTNSNTAENSGNSENGDVKSLIGEGGFKKPSEGGNDGSGLLAGLRAVIGGAFAVILAPVIIWIVCWIIAIIAIIKNNKAKKGE